MELKDLTVVITTFKSDIKVLSCINSLPREIKILIIENSNNQKFKEEIEKTYSQVECILTGENKGYSAANNIGLQKTKTKYALLLNPDTIVARDTIKNFFIAAESNPDFWLLGPENKDNLNISDNNIVEVENLKGFALFFNLKKFDNTFFDENYFLYFEEIDLCKKVRNNNGKIYSDSNIIINHEGAGSVKTSLSEELEYNRNWHWMWSTFYFHKKYKGFLLAMIIIFPKLISSFIKTIFYQIIFNKEKRNIYYYRLSGLINSILGKRSWYRPTID
tara:strand:+ start:990 stop:1817 length:828 start_codon:yes stop_codon:yes gene_type:complete